MRKKAIILAVLMAIALCGNAQSSANLSSLISDCQFSACLYYQLEIFC